MRKIVLLGLALVVIVGALIAAPRLVDPAAYRDILTTELRRSLGEDIQIAGPLTVALLPTPHLTAADIRLGDDAGAPSGAMRAAWLEARLAPLPLLIGRVALRSVTLIDPVVDLTKLSSSAARRLALPSGNMPIGALRIVNGTILYTVGGNIEKIEAIDLDVTARDPAGPLHASGGFSTRGVSPTIDFNLDKIAAPSSFSLALDLARPAAHLQLAGELTDAPETGLALDGTLKLTSDELATLLSRTGISAVSPARRFAASGHLSASGAALRLDKLSLALDDARGEGAVALHRGAVPDVAVALRFNQLELDRLPAATLPAWSPPPALHGKLDLAVTALSWRGAVIRDARLQAHLAEGTLSVDRLAGILPGNSTLSLDGKLSFADRQPVFTGAIDAGSDNLRELLRWAGITTSGIPADRLRKATLASRFTARPDRIDIGDLDLVLDASHFTGAATLLPRKRPAVGARLAVDQLNLDAYLPAPAAGAPGTSWLGAFDANIDAKIATLTWRGQPIRGIHAAATLQNGDLTVREASIADLAGASGTASGLATGLTGNAPSWHAAFTMKGDELSHLVRLAAPDAPFAWRLGGAFSGGGDIAGDGDATAVAIDLAAMGGTLHVDGEIGGTKDPAGCDLAVEISHPSFASLLRAAGGAYLPAGGDPGAVKAAGRLRIAQDRIGLDDLAVSLGSLSLAGSATLDRTGARPKLSAQLSFNDLAVERWLPTRQTAARSGDGRIWLAAANAPSPAGWSHAPIDLSALGLLDADLALHGDRLSYGAIGIDQPQTTLKLQDGTLQLTALTGTLFDGALSAHGAVASSNDAMSTEISLHGATLGPLLNAAFGVSPLAGTGDIDLSLVSSGADLASLVAGLHGDGRIASSSGSILGLDLPALSARLGGTAGATDIFELTRGLSGGTTPYKSLSGTFRIASGVVSSDDIALNAAAAAAQARMTLDLPAWSLRSRIEFHLTDHPEVPPFALSLEGPLDAPRKIIDVNAIEAYLTHRGAPTPR